MMTQKKMVEAVKAAAQDLMDRAEDIVGQTDYMTDFDIWLRFSPDNSEAPTIEVTKRVIARKSAKIALDLDFDI